MISHFIHRSRWSSGLGLALLGVVGCSEGSPSYPTSLPPQFAPGGGGPPIQVDSTDPSNAQQGTTLDVRVLGQNFENGAKVDFLLNGSKTPDILTNSSSFVNSTEVVANITIAPEATVDLYDVRVTVSGKKPGVGIEKFEVTSSAIDVVVTMREGVNGTDAVRADDAANTPYPEPGHITGTLGRLMFWLGEDHPRAVRITTSAFDGVTRRRVFTNTHTNPGGDDAAGFLGMVNGSTGSAVFEVELFNRSTEPYEALRYGKDCAGTGSGGGNVVPATKVVTTRSSDGRTWTITGASGVHCKQVTKKPGLTQVGTAGPFAMTLVEIVP